QQPARQRQCAHPITPGWTLPLPGAGMQPESKPEEQLAPGRIVQRAVEQLRRLFPGPTSLLVIRPASQHQRPILRQEAVQSWGEALGRAARYTQIEHA